jgi:hypothetical protein
MAGSEVAGVGACTCVGCRGERGAFSIYNGLLEKGIPFSEDKSSILL